MGPCITGPSVSKVNLKEANVTFVQAHETVLKVTRPCTWLKVQRRHYLVSRKPHIRCYYMWQSNLFQHLASLCSPNHSIFTTLFYKYCYELLLTSFGFLFLFLFLLLLYQICCPRSCPRSCPRLPNLSQLPALYASNQRVTHTHNVTYCWLIDCNTHCQQKKKWPPTKLSAAAACTKKNWLPATHCSAVLGLSA